MCAMSNTSFCFVRPVTFNLPRDSLLLLYHCLSLMLNVQFFFITRKNLNLTEAGFDLYEKKKNNIYVAIGLVES